MGEEILSVFSSWRLFRNDEDRVARWRIFYFFDWNCPQFYFVVFVFQFRTGTKIKKWQKSLVTLAPFEADWAIPPPPPTPCVVCSTHIFWSWINEGVGGGGREAPPALSSWKQIPYTIKRVAWWHIVLATVSANVFYFVILLFFILFYSPFWW